MTFFYDLNKKLADIAKKQDLNESVGSTSGFLEGSTGDYSAKKARAGKDIGKPGKMFSKIAKSAGERYGSKERGEKVAGAVLAKLRAKESVAEADMEEGNEFSGELAKAKATGAKEFKVDGKTYPVKEASINIPGASMPTGPFDNRHWLDITGSKDKNFKVAKPDHELDGKTVTVIAYSKNGKSVVVTADGKRYNLSPRDLEQRVREAKAKPDYIDLDQDGNRKESMKKAAADKKKSKSAGTAFDPEVARSMFANKDEHPRYDVKDTGYSKRYTRKEEPAADKDDEVSDQPKKKGRPKGPEKGPERVTAKSYKYKAGRPAKTKEDLDTDGVMMTRSSNMSSESIDSIALTDKGEYDREGDMAKDQLHTLVKASKELHSILDDDDNLPEWVQSKITKALDYIKSANDYMDQEKHDSDRMEPVAEKAVSKAQRAAAGIAHAAQKGDIPKSELRGASKEMAKMPAGELKKFAKTKEKGLPEKVKEADVEAPKAKKGGFEFGKGVYESMNGKVESMITESMNINVSMSTGQNGEPTKSITVNAEGEDAEALAALLKMAGIGGHRDAESCDTCGKAPCGCEELDENSPDWPTNTETSDNALQYSGGLNGPKSTGQTTVPVIASQERRLHSESVELEHSLFKLYQNYKSQ
jgi:hypothetical protein